MRPRQPFANSARQEPPLWGAFIRFSVIAAVLCVVASGTAPVASATDHGAGMVAVEGTELAGRHVEPARHQAVAEVDPTWMDRIDEFFGRFLVRPLTKVLFFDFGTEHWLGASVPFVVVWLLAGGIFFTLRMNFINVRGFWHAIRVTKGDYDDPEEPGEVSHFQALSSALSATVGLGNIAGVAIAVGRGGPGAIFWVVLAGLLGMSSKFSECTLGQLYRKVAPDGTISGGPMHYLRDGLGELGLPRLGGFLAVAFAILCIGASFGGGCAFQVGQSLGQVKERVPFFDHFPWVYGLVMAFFVGIVIIGGIRRIAATASKIVPLMCGMYVLASIYILVVNYDQLLPAFGLILRQALTGDAIEGGAIGIAVIGITRGVFSNEAGIGSASIAHAAAKTDEPVSEGVVALLEPFIDTVVVCTMTGLVIVITGVYMAPEYQHLVQNDEGAALTSKAMASVVSWFPYLLTVAVVLFAYSTMISWSYYGERCWTALLGPDSSIVYKSLFLGFVLLGSIVTATNILNFSDLMILTMALPNILGMLLLSGKIRRALDGYWAKYQTGRLKLTRKTGSEPEGPVKK